MFNNLNIQVRHLTIYLTFRLDLSGGVWYKSRGITLTLYFRVMYLYSVSYLTPTRLDF